LAVITEVFHDDPGGRRLTERLRQARDLGATLAVLPELPLDRWVPATKQASDDDDEPPDGRRQALQSAAAAAAGIALLGGAIVRDPLTGTRHNTAVLFGPAGRVLTRYRKLHLPEEEGFWETYHYDAGDQPPGVVTDLGMPIGIQLCSDLNRPEGCHQLAAQGAELILAPRATPGDTYARWQLVLRADAVTSCTYVASANRPGGSSDFPTGGASLVVGPDGTVLLETTEPLALVDLDRNVVRATKAEYPGYLPVRADVYARGWATLARAKPGADA
jgi:N-carbamoylputrescine amidase